MTGHRSILDTGIMDKYEEFRAKRIEIFRKISRLEEERYKINQELRKLHKEVKELEK